MAAERAIARGPAVWTASSLDERDWLVPLEDGWLGALETLYTSLRAAGPTGADTTPEDFRTTEGLSSLAERVTWALERGPGMVVLRGWRVAEWGDATTSLLACGLGSLLGTPRPHDAEGSRFNLVRDTTSATAAPGGTQAPTLRPGASNQALALHTDWGRPPCDPPRVLGLLCLRPAAEGGESLIVSGHSVHNRLLEQHPDLLDELFRPFRFGRRTGVGRDGLQIDFAPVFHSHSGRLTVRYNRQWIERGHEAAAEPLPTSARAALEVFDQLLADASLQLRFSLLAGDLLFLNNLVLLHGRTAFVDYQNPAARRCLARFLVD